MNLRTELCKGLWELVKIVLAMFLFPLDFTHSGHNYRWTKPTFISSCDDLHARLPDNYQTAIENVSRFVLGWYNNKNKQIERFY